MPDYRKTFRIKRFIDRVTGFTEWIDANKKAIKERQKKQLENQKELFPGLHNISEIKLVNPMFTTEQVNEYLDTK